MNSKNKNSADAEEFFEHGFVGVGADDGEGEAGGIEDFLGEGEDFVGVHFADAFIDGIGVHDAALGEDGTAEAHVLAGGALEGHSAGADGVFLCAAEFGGGHGFFG